jgi:two-component system, cell cycle response regulator CpdR
MVQRLISILVVEDEIAMRDLVMRMLSEKGYGVLTANSADEALDVLRQRSVDLLLTDIMMPGTDGVKLAKKAERLRPGLKVMFITGYVELATRHDAMRHGPVLYKPVRPAELMRGVEQVLAA